jgi:hypothetical protein
VTEVKYNQAHHAGGTAEARINSRLRNSGEGANPDVTVQKGSSPNRTFTNVHNNPNKSRDEGKGGR